MLKKLSNPYFLVAVISLTATSAVSAMVAVALRPWFPYFKEIFFIATSLQFILFFILNTLLQRRDSAKYLQTILENKKELIVAAKTTCAYCKQLNDISINFEQDNYFKCDYCGIENSVKIQILSAQTVKPVEDASITITKTLNQQS